MSRKLLSRDFSIIASNCVGGTIYGDFSLQYSSPFVGLFILPKDFIQLCSDLEYYLGLPLLRDDFSKMTYPVGKLGNILIHFVHYKNFAQAKAKWDRRKVRINFDSLFFILVERDGCTLEDIEKFDSLFLEKKLVLTAGIYPYLKSTFQLHTYKNCLEVGDCTSFVAHRLGFRHMYQFDFIGWLN